MRKAFFLTSISVFAFCINCNSQLAENIKSQLIKEWQRAKVYTLEYLAAMPVEKYDFRAMDSVRSFSQQMLHLAEDIDIMVSYGTGEKRKWAGQNIEARVTAQSVDSVKYFVVAGYDFAIEAINKLVVSKFEEKVKVKKFEESRFAWLLKAFEHQTHHRGQTTIYIRLAGIRPPPERLF